MVLVLVHNDAADIRSEDTQRGFVILEHWAIYIELVGVCVMPQGESHDGFRVIPAWAEVGAMLFQYAFAGHLRDILHASCLHRCDIQKLEAYCVIESMQTAVCSDLMLEEPCVVVNVFFFALSVGLIIVDYIV